MTSLATRQPIHRLRVAFIGLASNFPELVLIVALGIALIGFWSYGARVIAYPYQVDYGEGPLLDQAVRIAHGENIYRADLSKPPFVIANYPPLFVLAQAPLTAIFGPAFWYGRVLSWLSSLAAAIFIALILQTLTRHWLASIIGGATFLVIPYVLAWSPLNRVDPLALALSLAALFVITRWHATQRGLIATAILLLAAAYTRQSYGLAAPFAAFVWLLGQRPRQRAFVLAAIVGGAGLGLFCVINALTQGGFYFNLVTANANEFQIETLTRYLMLTLNSMPGLLACALGFLVLAIWRRARAAGLLIPYLLGTTLTGLTIGKIGSNVNYLLEFSAAVSLIAGVAVAGLRQWRAQSSGAMRRAIAWTVSIVFALAFLGQVDLLMRAEGSYHKTILQQTQQTIENQVLLKIIQQTRGIVLADQHMGLLVLAGRPIYYQPFEMKQIATAGAWDQTPFLQALERQEFPVILTYRPVYGSPVKRRWTDEMLATLERKYRTEQNLSNTLVLRPR